MNAKEKYFADIKNAVTKDKADAEAKATAGRLNYTDAETEAAAHAAYMNELAELAADCA